MPLNIYRHTKRAGHDGLSYSLCYCDGPCTDIFSRFFALRNTRAGRDGQYWDDSIRNPLSTQIDICVNEGDAIESSQYCPSCPARAFLSARNREKRLYIGAIFQRHNSIMNMTVHHAQRVSYPVPTAVHVPKRE